MIRVEAAQYQSKFKPQVLTAVIGREAKSIPRSQEHPLADAHRAELVGHLR
jgi:hypothetical protein